MPRVLFNAQIGESDSNEILAVTVDQTTKIKIAKYLCNALNQETWKFSTEKSSRFMVTPKVFTGLLTMEEWVRSVIPHSTHVPSHNDTFSYTLYMFIAGWLQRL